MKPGRSIAAVLPEMVSVIERRGSMAKPAALISCTWFAVGLTDSVHLAFSVILLRRYL